MARHISPRAVRRMLMDGGSKSELTRLTFIASGFAPLVHAALLAQGQESADAIHETLNEMPEDTEPLHASVDKAMEEAAAAAEEAFSKAIVAASRFLLMMDRCKCQQCQINRQRANADMQ